MSQAKKKKLYYMMVVCCLLGFKFGTLGLELLILLEQSKLPTETMRLFLYLLNHVDITRGDAVLADARVHAGREEDVGGLEVAVRDGAVGCGLLT